MNSCPVVAFRRAVNICSPANVQGTWRRWDGFYGTQWLGLGAAAMVSCGKSWSQGFNSWFWFNARLSWWAVLTQDIFGCWCLNRLQQKVSRCADPILKKILFCVKQRYVYVEALGQIYNNSTNNNKSCLVVNVYISLIFVYCIFVYLNNI